MPLYEYKCDRCQTVFEVIQKFSDAPLKEHKECGGGVERLVSVSALQFKGSGFYITDYAKGKSGSPKTSNGENGGNGAAAAKSDSSSGSSSTSSSTPAASTATATTSTSTTSSESKK